MTHEWKSYEGILFHSAYPLLSCFQQDEHGGTFRTHYGAQQLPATLRLVERAALLSHPNVVSVLHHGEGYLNEEIIPFLLTESAEDTLAEVVTDRALSVEETREVAESVTAALQYLHGLGAVHGSVRPTAVFAVKDQIKLLIDNPHADASPAEDVRGLGLLLLQCLTGKPPEAVPAKRISQLPSPFRQIITNSLLPKPADRWGIDQIASALSGNFLVPEVHRQGPIPIRPESSKRAKFNRDHVRRNAAIASAVVLAGFLGWQYTRQAPKPAPVSAFSAPSTPSTPVGPPAAPPKESSRTREAAPPKPQKQATGNQYVIVATYNRLEDARKRAKSISHRWPQFRADVQAPHRPNPPYIVTIGANLSKEAATRLQQRARAAGLPRDTYVQSF